MSRSKAKGRRAEHDIAKRHIELGVPAKRMPLSGSLGGEWSDDVELPYGHVEVKSRANAAGWRVIIGWMKQCPAIFLKQDRVDPLVVLTWATYADLVAHKYGSVTLTLDYETHCDASSPARTNTDHPATQSDAHGTA